MRYDDEAETLVRSRVVADAIMRELATRLPPQAPSPGACEVEVLPPPPRTLAASVPPWPSASEGRKKPPANASRKEGTKLHWAVLSMAAAIAVGLWLDPVSRVRVFAQARATTAQVMGKLPHR